MFFLYRCPNHPLPFLSGHVPQRSVPKDHPGQLAQESCGQRPQKHPAHLQNQTFPETARPWPWPSIVKRLPVSFFFSKGEFILYFCSDRDKSCNRFTVRAAAPLNPTHTHAQTHTHAHDTLCSHTYTFTHACSHTYMLTLAHTC